MVVLYESAAGDVASVRRASQRGRGRRIECSLFSLLAAAITTMRETGRRASDKIKCDHGEIRADSFSD